MHVGALQAVNQKLKDTTDKFNQHSVRLRQNQAKIKQLMQGNAALDKDVQAARTEAVAAAKELQV